MSDQKFKADAGKVDHSLLELGFPNALAFVEATLMYGAEKYEAHSWRRVPDAFNRYDKAARRHRRERDRAMAIYLSGYQDPKHAFVVKDEESNLPHIAHELFNLMAQIELFLQDNPCLSVDEMLKYYKPPTEHKNDSSTTTC